MVMQLLKSIVSRISDIFVRFAILGFSTTKLSDIQTEVADIMAVIPAGSENNALTITSRLREFVESFRHWTLPLSAAAFALYVLARKAHPVTVTVTVNNDGLSRDQNNGGSLIQGFNFNIPDVEEDTITCPICGVEPPEEREQQRHWVLIRWAADDDKEDIYFCSMSCLEHWVLYGKPSDTSPIVNEADDNMFSENA